ncbi:glycoprotein-N-acetylgalactosamine 3-beta-galactosyltransferase 1-like isoform X2 [Watersipora subatra]
MAYRNQFFVGIITGIIVSLIVLGILRSHNGRDDLHTPNFSNLRGLGGSAGDSAAVQMHMDALRKQEIALKNEQSSLQGKRAADPSYAPLPEIEGLLPHHSDNHQEDDTSLADMLYSKVRILCWVMTSPDNLEKKAIHVYKTWAHKCNKLLFISSKENKTFPAPVIRVETEEGREHLTAKTMHAFKYIYDNHFTDADWFMKADDDTFAIMENLRYFLADKNPKDPVYYGHHFKTIVKPQGYYSGGGGYVLSKEALQRFNDKGFHNDAVCREDGGAEDAEFGKCMQNLGVHTAESYDERGASRFHCFNPGTHLHGGYPDWYLQYDSHGAVHGVDKVSDYPITFHYVNPQEMYSLAWYTYHLKVYGHASRAFPKLHEYYVK